MASLSFIAPISPHATPPKGSLGDSDDSTILVYPHIVFNNLNAISMLEQTFETEIQLELTWMDGSVAERLANGETWGDVRQNLWHPGLRLDNCAEIKDSEYWFRLVDQSTGLVAFVVRMLGVFRERFELKRFPFDCQWLTLRLSSCWKEVRFSGDWPAAYARRNRCPSRDDFVNLKGFILEDYEPFPVACLQARKTRVEQSASSSVYHELNAKLMIRRRSAYYLWNIALIDFLLVLTSLTVLLVPAEEFADRMAMSLTLLLTAIAFKQVVSMHLPSISYLTTLDKYVLFGFGMQVLVVAQNAAAKFEVDRFPSSYLADTWGGVLLVVYLIAYQSAFAYEMYHCIYRRGSANVIARFYDEAPHTGHSRWHRITFNSDAVEEEALVQRFRTERASSALSSVEDGDEAAGYMDFECEREAYALRSAQKAHSSYSSSPLSSASHLIARASGAAAGGPVSAEAYIPLGAEGQVAVRRIDSPDPQMLARRSPGVQSGQPKQESRGTGSLFVGNLLKA
jgi:hypothetical protein